MEASALNHAAVPALAGRSPLLRLQGDEKLIALVRKGHNGAFEALVQRYQPRLLAFCRHMLSSQEDAEDVLQEVFTAAYNALLGDNRPVNARPWLYRIARNRCLNHLRKPRATGQDSMDIFERDNGATTAETVHRREEFRQIVTDVGDLPETQRTALLLREIDALSYDQIAEAMDTTVPSVKSLLVRARVNLAEAAEARLLTCGEVRLELGQVAEGLAKSSAPVRRHLKSCTRCRTFRSELRSTTKALAAVYPLGPLVMLKKLGLAKLGLGGGAAAGGAAAGGSGFAGSAGIAAGGAATAASAAGGAASGALSAGIGTLASKAAAGMAAAVIVTAGAVEVKQVTKGHAPAHTAAAPAPAAPAPPPIVVKPRVRPAQPAKAKAASKPKRAPRQKVGVKAPPRAPAEKPVTAPAPAPPPVQVQVQEDESTATLPPRDDAAPTAPPSQVVTTPPGEPPAGRPQSPPPAPPAGEPVPTQPAPPLPVP